MTAYKLFWEIPMERKHAIETQAKMLCIIAGIEPVDPLDGSHNWWIFHSQAEDIVDDIRKRFPPITEEST